jgi:hypothetical protein
VSDKKRVEVQKFKSELNKVMTGAGAQQKIQVEKNKLQQQQQVQAGMDSLLSGDGSE